MVQLVAQLVAELVVQSAAYLPTQLAAQLGMQLKMQLKGQLVELKVAWLIYLVPTAESYPALMAPSDSIFVVQSAVGGALSGLVEG